MVMATNSDYWKKREQENRNRNIRSEAEYAKEIRKTYEFAMDQIQREIDSFYAKYAEKEGITIAQAKKRASKLDMEEYSRKAKKYVKEKNFSKQANDEMRLYNLTMKVNRLELLKANIGLELVTCFDELQRFYEQTLTDRTMDEFTRQAGILGSAVPDNAAVLAATIVNASFHNAKYSERIWMHQDLLRNELGKLLTRGMVQGKNPRVLARELRKTFNTSIHNSERLMQTELARVQTEAQLQSYKENGFEEYEYLACHNLDACAICKALDGKIFKIDDGMPGENAPPMHPSCHCATTAHMDLDSYQKWLDGYKDHGLGFKEWENQNDSSIINSFNTKGKAQVHLVGRINKDIYKCVTEDIITDEVIITDKQIQHIKERHPNNYECYYGYFDEIVSNPDYIIRANKPNTALILKEIIEENEVFKTVLRLATPKDSSNYKNSIITFMKIDKKEWNRVLRNKKVLYRKE